MEITYKSKIHGETPTFTNLQSKSADESTLNPSFAHRNLPHIGRYWITPTLRATENHRRLSAPCGHNPCREWVEPIGRVNP